MTEMLFSFLKEMVYTNIVSVINYEDRGFSISVDFKYRWKDLNNKITYHNGHYVIDMVDFENYKKVQF
jgi:hypothetical protein